jgi:hypothetical protein
MTIRLADRWWAGAALALVLFAALATILLQPQFDGLYGQDAYAYYDYAVGPLRSSLSGLDRPPGFFWPPGYPLLVSAASVVIGRDPAAGQFVSLAAGAMVPIFTALFAREVVRGTDRLAFSGWRLPVIAGVVAAFTPQLWQSSIVVMSDTAALAAATLGAWLLARWGGFHGRGALLAGAAAATAFAILCRWAYALAAIPFALYALWVLLHMERGGALRHAALAGVAALAVLSPLLIVSGDEYTGGRGFAGDLETYSWSPANAFRSEFDTVDGHLSYRLPNGLYYAGIPAHRFYFTPLLAPFVAVGAWLALRTRAAAPLLLLLGWPLAIYLFHAGAPWQNFRFGLAYLPPLAILAAIGLEWLHLRLEGRVRALAPLAFAVALLVMAWGGLTLSQRFVDRKEADLGTVSWVERQADPDSQLFTFGLTLTFRHYSNLDTFELFDLQPGGLDALTATPRSCFLLLDVGSIERQWMTSSPGENLRWLRENRELRELGRYGSFTLFQIAPSSRSLSTSKAP